MDDFNIFDGDETIIDPQNPKTPKPQNPIKLNKLSVLEFQDVPKLWVHLFVSVAVLLHLYGYFLQSVLIEVTWHYAFGHLELCSYLLLKSL